MNRSISPWATPSRFAALLLALVVGGLPASAGATLRAAGGGRVFVTLDEALVLAFGEAQVERGTVYLTKEQLAQATKLAGEKVPTAIVHPYVARRDGVVIGTAWVDVHRVRSHKETLMIVVTPDQRVRRLELLAFAEPDEYIPRGNWYAQFLGRRLDDDLRLKRGIHGVTGATLTARATTSAVRRALALHRVLEGPPPPEPKAGASALAEAQVR